MSGHELLVGSAAFWTRAQADIAEARQRVLLQAMTFEGDAAGQAVAQAMLASAASDRRLLVDAYSLHVTNDRLLPLAPWQPRELRQEQRATRALFDRLVAGGVELRITNPVGRNPLRFPLRNHKKLLVTDDAAYLGGINVSDHNFAWHDLMMRIEDADVANFLAADLNRDWLGQPAGRQRDFGALRIVSLDGHGNEAALDQVLELLNGAGRSIEMIGAYPTLPFTAAMAAAARRGCAVTIYTPLANNKPLLRDGLLDLAATSPVRLGWLPEMTHAKVLLVDGECVLFGSVNFNLASYRSNGDLLAISRDPDLVADFERNVFAPARSAMQSGRPPPLAAQRGWRARVALTLADRVLARLPHGPVRALAWPGGRAAPLSSAER